MRTWANSTVNNRIIHVSLYMDNTKLQAKNNEGYSYEASQIWYLNKGICKRGHGQTTVRKMDLRAKLHG